MVLTILWLARQPLSQIEHRQHHCRRVSTGMDGRHMHCPTVSRSLRVKGTEPGLRAQPEQYCDRDGSRIKLLLPMAYRARRSAPCQAVTFL